MALWDGALGGEPLPGGGLQHEGGPLAGGPGGGLCGGAGGGLAGGPGGGLNGGPGGEDGGWGHGLSAGGAHHGAPQKHGAESWDCLQVPYFLINVHIYYKSKCLILMTLMSGTKLSLRYNGALHWHCSNLHTLHHCRSCSCL